jgi:hypothetical protein
VRVTRRGLRCAGYSARPSARLCGLLGAAFGPPARVGVSAGVRPPHETRGTLSCASARARGSGVACGKMPRDETRAERRPRLRQVLDERPRTHSTRWRSPRFSVQDGASRGSDACANSCRLLHKKIDFASFSAFCQFGCREIPWTTNAGGNRSSIRARNCLSQTDLWPIRRFPGQGIGDYHHDGKRCIGR